VTLVHQQDEAPLGTRKQQFAAPYLIKELINDEGDGFYKVINNGSARSTRPATDPILSALAEFLAFTQHMFNITNAVRCTG
jgi:hypothetical protein